MRRSPWIALVLSLAASAADPAVDARVTQVLSGIPGMDFSMLPASSQKELASMMTDEFCYCGCPHTLGACLKSHVPCKHARRMAKLAAGEAAAGAPATEISVKLTRYYLSFKEARATLKIDHRQCQGAADAKVTLVEYFDYECPFCGLARRMLEQFAKDNASKVRFCVQPYPLQQHPNALPGGQAALFSRDEGKFWAMHDILFEHQTSLSPDTIKQLAGKVGLNVAELSKVLGSQKFIDELNASKEAGKAAGVVATPTLFVNGRKLDLPLTPELLQHTLEDEQEWMAHNGWAAD